MAARQHFTAQRAEVLSALPGLVGKGVTKSLGPLFDKAGNLKKLVALFTPVYTDEVRDAGQQAMLLITAEDFNYEDPAVTKFLKNRTLKVSAAIDDETDKQLRTSLIEGLSKGENIEELSARVENIYGAAAGYRADRIARTETIHANNFASEEAWKQTGVVQSKEWFTAQDERVCEYCGPMDGKIVDLGGSYFDKGDEYTGSNGGTLKLDFESIETPPLHSNCRCTILPVLE
jgi:SPP1 gp7 family putative phage head morphogenesis protein